MAVFQTGEEGIRVRESGEENGYALEQILLMRLVHVSLVLTGMPRSWCRSGKSIATPLIECTGFGGTV